MVLTTDSVVMSREDLTGSESLLPIRSGLDGPVWASLRPIRSGSVVWCSVVVVRPRLDGPVWASLGPIRGGLSELDGPVWTSLLLPIRGH